MDTFSAPRRPRPAPGVVSAPSGSRDRGVVALPRRGDRVCARPSCRELAIATLSFSYTDRLVELASLSDEPFPQTYDLCQIHAARTRPPHGWELRDRRPEDDRPLDRQTRVPADLGGDRTVAVLAAALRAVPGAVSEDARPVPTAEVAPAPPPRQADVRSMAVHAAPGDAPGAGPHGRSS